MSATYPPPAGDSGNRDEYSSSIGPSSDVPVPLPGLRDSDEYVPGSVPVNYGGYPPAPPPQAEPEVRQRRIWLPVVLFVLTCFSTFLAGATEWMPASYLGFEIAGVGADGLPRIGFDLMPLRRTLYSHWDEGLIYMGCVLAILLTHEMGHFVMTIVYRVRASFPFFIPLPISPIGTMGAVIAMDGRKANRKEIFDIGLAGPLAGLVVAIPILVIGTMQLDFTRPPSGAFTLDLPLIVRLLLASWDMPGYDAAEGVSVGQANPLFLAGWVGLLVTGLNMLPVSQLDGGHVTYGLLGRGAHWVARGFMLLVFAYMAFSGNFMWILMAVLVLMMGTDHPPTSNDSVKLGVVRTIVGWLSLLIPIFCFAPHAIY